jgi:hypothetical protein
MRPRLVPYLLLIAILLGGCVSGTQYTLNDELAPDAIKQAVKQLKYYPFDPETEVHERLKVIPDILLGALMTMDETDVYRAHEPTKQERAMLKQYLALMPQKFNPVIKDRLVGIYIVDNFIGSGLTDYIYAPDGTLYTVIVLNSNVFELGISELLTKKERTCFIAAEEISITINAGDKYTGLMYILTHEIVHVLDYVDGLTPWVEEAFMPRDLLSMEGTALTRDVWAYRKTPKFTYDFPMRKEIVFYGLGEGPKINISSAKDMYRSLGATPFTSLYASMNWAEDVAELGAFYHLTQVLKQPYEIAVQVGYNAPVSYRPMNNPKVMERFKHLDELFYKTP